PLPKRPEVATTSPPAESGSKTNEPVTVEAKAIPPAVTPAATTNATGVAPDLAEKPKVVKEIRTVKPPEEPVAQEKSAEAVAKTAQSPDQTAPPADTTPAAEKPKVVREIRTVIKPPQEPVAQEKSAEGAETKPSAQVAETKSLPEPAPTPD